MTLSHTEIAQELHHDETRFLLDYYRASPYQLSFTIDVPPRYATGGLHVGHSLGYITIDILSRFRTMTGYSTFVPLCFDINGTPLEIAAEKRYKIDPSIGRELYLERCMELAQENITKMSEDFRSMFVRMHRNIRYTTADDDYRRITQITFAQLWRKRLVYRRMFPVNWCIGCQTALAEAEIEKTPVSKILYEIDFGQTVRIATSRPELLGACVAIAVAPGMIADRALPKQILLPLYDRIVPIIESETVDPSFGTGMMQISIFGDEEDVLFALRHNLDMSAPAIQEDGTLRVPFVEGQTVSQARQTILQLLGDRIRNHTEYQTQNRVCWRCAREVEILSKRQWFLKTLMFKEQIKEAASKLIWRPAFMRERLNQWVDELKWDWVISRQRLLATSIPVWECDRCDQCKIAEETVFPIEMYRQEPISCISRSGCSGTMRPSTEVFDTWFDSSITVLYNTGWENRGWRWAMENDFRQLRLTIPMSLRVQGHDIIRSWAFYTILRCHQLIGTVPFDELWINGFVRTDQGEEMHTSKGNTIRPGGFIERYGADAYRFFVTCLRLGQDHLFQEQNIVTGAHLIRKLENIKIFVTRYCADRITSIRAAALRYDPSWSETRQREFFIAMNPQNVCGLFPKKIQYHGDDPILRHVLHSFNQMLDQHQEEMKQGNFFDAMRRLQIFTERVFSALLIEYLKKDTESERLLQQHLVHSLFLNLIQVYAPFFPGVTNHWFKELGYEGQTIHRTHRLYCPIIYASKIHLSNKPPEIQGFLQVLHALRRHRTNKQLRWSELILEIQIDQRYRSSLLEFVPALKILGRTSQIRFVDHLPLETVLEELRVDVQMIRQSFEPTEAGMILSMIKQADLKTFQFTTENELIIPGSTLKVPSTMFEKRYGTIGEQPKEIEIFELGPYGYLRIEAS